MWVVKSGTNDPSLLENGVKSQRTFFFPLPCCWLKSSRVETWWWMHFEMMASTPAAYRLRRTGGMFLPFFIWSLPREKEEEKIQFRWSLLSCVCVFQRKINGWLNRLVVTDPAGWTLGRCRRPQRLSFKYISQSVGRWGSAAAAAAACLETHKEPSVSKEI